MPASWKWYRFTPDKGIDYCPEQERDEDPGSPPPEELPCLIMKGELQIGRGNYEEGDGCSGQHIQYRDPDGI